MSKQKTSVIKLNFPITIDGQKIDHLTLRRPSVKDMLEADSLQGNEGSKEVQMFANLCSVPLDLIERLDLADYNKLQEGYKSFLS